MSWYETPRQRGGAGSSPSAGDTYASEGHDVRRGCRFAGCVIVVGETLEGGVEERRRRGPRCQTPSRQDATNFSPAEAATGEVSPAWSRGGGLSDRPVDLSACGGGDSTTVRRP